MPTYYCKSCGNIVNRFSAPKQLDRCPYCNVYASFYYLEVREVFADGNGFVTYDDTACIRSNCKAKKVVISDRARRLDDYMHFQNNEYIEEVVFPRSIDNIVSYYCAGCTKIRRVVIPGNVKIIGNSAFQGCTSLREVVISEGVREIEDWAFSSCKNLEKVVLPSSLEIIGKYAFSDCSIKYARLPNGLNDIGTKCLGYSPEPSVYVTKNSRTERYIKSEYPNPKYALNENYIISNKGVIDHVLYCRPVEWNERITLPYDTVTIADQAFKGSSVAGVACNGSLEVIKTEAFSNCNYLDTVTFNNGLKIIDNRAFLVDGKRGKLKVIEIPGTVKRIGKEAFKGHKIEKIAFKNGIEEIGDNAFADSLIWEVDLPKSIKTVAPNAFPKGTFISVDGMPLEIFMSSTDYFIKEKQLNEKIREIESLINNKKIKVSSNQGDIVAFNSKINSREKEIEDTAVSIKSFEKDKEETSFDVDKQVKILDSRILSVNESIIKAENERDLLKNELNQTFLFAISKKRNLTERIADKESAIIKLQDEKKSYEVQKEGEEKRQQDVENRLQCAIDKYTNLLELTEKEKEQIDKNTKENSRIQSEIKGDEESLNELKKELSRLIEEFEKKNKSKFKELEKKKLLAEKECLIRSLPEPRCKTVKIPEYKENSDDIIDQTLLRKAFEIIPKRENEKSLREVLPQLYKDNKKSIDRIKAINRELVVDPFDGIDQFASLDKGEGKYEVELPERFRYLYDFFSENEAWIQLYGAKDDKKQDRGYIGSFFTEFFDGIKFVPLVNNKVNNTVLAFTPYCILLVRNLVELSVLKYDDTSINYECTEKDYKRPPADREIVSQHYLHQNADGTPNKRYKDNYLIYSTRLNFIAVASGKHSYKISIPTKSEAENFIYRFKEFKETLADGLRGKVYQAFLESKDLDEIKSIVSEEERIKKEREEQEKLRLEELARKEEEKRIAEEKEKEEKRKAIIERQRQLNEERKAQKEAEKEKITKIISMFEDDEDAFFGEKKENVAVAKEKSNGPLEVVGNKLISNNVFKIVFKQSTDLPEDTLTLYFTDNKGHIISNRKSYVVPDVGAETKVGFILKSGIDFTQMDSCTLAVEAEEDICQEIIFKMNISFYSDF